MYRHTAIINNITPFVPSAGRHIPSGKQIRGLFGYVALDLGLDIANYFINPNDDKIIFKNPYPLDSYMPVIKMYQYKRGLENNIIMAVSSAHRFEFEVYTLDKDTAEKIDAVFRFLIKTNTFSIGKGRNHGFGRFNIDFYKVKKEDLEFTTARKIKISLKDNFFLKKGNSVKRAILSSFKRFGNLIDSDIDVSDAEVIQPSFYIAQKGRIDMYIEQSKKKVQVMGDIYVFNHPISISFGRNVKICKCMDRIWGVGDCIQFGYGDFSFL